MNLRLLSLGVAAGLSLPAAAQTRDPVVEALNHPQGGTPKRSAEVSVVLEEEGQPLVPDAAKPKPDQKTPPAATGEPQTTPATPLLVTGKPPADAQQLDSEKEPEKGVAVRVESLQTGGGPIDPAQVKLLAPFAAKPLAEPPAGWVYDATATAPPFVKQVELSPGSHITLSIRPHVLVPVSDGANFFNLQEPGFEAGLGYKQASTVGSILSDSIHQLDEDSKRLGFVIDRLQQLLVSLPPDKPAKEAPIGPVPSPLLQSR